MILSFKTIFFNKIILATVIISLCACTQSKHSVSPAVEKISLHEMLMNLVDADRTSIYAYYGEPSSEIALSPTFHQLVYQKKLWHDMEGELIFYLEDDQIRSIAFVLPVDGRLDEEAMDSSMQQWYGENREEQISLLTNWYQRDAHDSWFSDELEDMVYTLGKKADYYWLYGDDSGSYDWVISTHSGTYPYEFIAFIPTDKFQFGRLDYLPE